MKVLINTPDLKKNGGVAQYYNAIKPLYKIDTDYLVSGAREDGEPLYKILVRFVFDYARFIAKLCNSNYDLIHLNPSFCSKALVRDGIFLLISKVFGKKVLIFNHGWDEKTEHQIRTHCLSLFRMVFSRADAYIVLASGFKRKLVELGYSNPIFVETTVVEDFLFSAGDDACTIRKNRQYKDFKILFLSRIEIGKGVYESLDAFHLLKKKYPEISMIFAGDGSELANLRRYAANHNMTDIEFTGYVSGSAKSDVFSRADVYLFPSWSEGMPISVLEAMSYGLPVVTRPVGGIPDFFENGKMGFVTESKDPEVLADLLGKLIDDREGRLSMGDFNHRYAREHFQPSIIAGRLERIYRDILAQQD